MIGYLSDVQFLQLALYLILLFSRICLYLHGCMTSRIRVENGTTKIYDGFWLEMHVPIHREVKYVQAGLYICTIEWVDIRCGNMRTRSKFTVNINGELNLTCLPLEVLLAVGP